MNDEVRGLRLLDDIEDAKERLTEARRALRLGIGLIVAGVALVIGTAVAQIAFALPDGLGFIHILYAAIIFFGGTVSLTTLDFLPSARRTLKLAERAHRDWTMGGDR